MTFAVHIIPVTIEDRPGAVVFERSTGQRPRRGDFDTVEGFDGKNQNIGNGGHELRWRPAADRLVIDFEVIAGENSNTGPDGIFGWGPPFDAVRTRPSYMFVS